MSVYHFEQGKLVKLADDIDELLGDDIDQGYRSAGWSISEDVEGAYVLYAASGMKQKVSPLQQYAYAFMIEDFNGTLPWTIWVRDDLVEYLEVMRLIQPLIVRVQQQVIGAEITRRNQQ